LSLALVRRAPNRQEAKEFPQEHGGTTGVRLSREQPPETPGSFTEKTNNMGTTTTPDRSYKRKTHRKETAEEVKAHPHG
jgi:hypothetical protein